MSNSDYTHTVKERPAPVVFGKTIKERTPWGNIYVTLNYDGGEPFETFITVGKSGSELKAMTEALSRVISIALRSGWGRRAIAAVALLFALCHGSLLALLPLFLVGLVDNREINLDDKLRALAKLRFNVDSAAH